MTTTQEGYGARYEKIKTNRLRSVSPGHYQSGEQSPRPHPSTTGQNQLGKVVAQLADRVDGIEIKIVNITNIIKLFQKYTETKDNQYEKQKQNEQFRKNIGQRVTHIESLEIQTKINELESLIQRTKTQMNAMEALRIGVERQSSKRVMCSPDPFDTIPKTIQSPVSSKEVMGEIQDILDQMELNLREEMNKKIDICMTFFKNATQAATNNKNSPSTLNALMVQQQLDNMTFTINKVQSDCCRNKMIVENKIEQIIDYVNTIRGKRVETREKESIHSNSRSIPKKSRQVDENHSQQSSISKHSKRSKSKSKSKRNIVDSSAQEMGKSKLEEQRRQKEQELKQALRKKKENQQKLKMKR